MTNYLGPLTLEHFHIFENDDTKKDGSESINLICSVEQAHQILGLCENSVKNDYGDLRILRSRNSRWSILPVQTNDNMKVNEHLAHSGLYQLLDLEYEAMGNRPDIVTVHLAAEMLSKNVNEILSVNYSRGGEDGSDIKMAYKDLTAVYEINEDGSDFDTINDWYAAATSAMTSGTIASSGGEIVLSGRATTDGTYGSVWTCHRTQFDHGFIMEFTMKPGTKPAAGSHVKDLNVWFGPTRTSTPPIWNNSVVVSLGANSSDVYYSINTVGAPGGATWRNMVPRTVDNTATAFKFRITTDSKYNVKIELNRYVGTAWTGWSEIYNGPTNIDGWTDLYFGAAFNNKDSTTNSMSIDTIQVYDNVEVDSPNIVVAPPGAICNLTPDFTRTGEEGAIQCFKDIVDDLNYQIDPDSFYDGSVKAWNSNYTDAVPRLVTHNEVDLDLTKFYVTNGLVKLVTTSNGVSFYYWNGTNYTFLNLFTLPTPIRLIRPFYVDKDTFTLQLDRTFWTIRSGKPYIWVEHPYDAIGKSSHFIIYHDGVRMGGGVDIDVSMLTQFYSLGYTPYNLLTSNQYSVETDLTGWGVTGGTIRQEGSGGYIGSNCILVETANLNPYEGLNQTIYSSLPVTPAVGLPICAYAYCKGVGTVVVQITERDSNGTGLTSSMSSVYTLSLGYTKLSHIHTISNPLTRSVSMKILTPTTQAAYIYSDAHGIGPAPVGVVESSYAPVNSARYGGFITQKYPTTIKSDSIPACEITGIGVFDQMRPASYNSGYLSLAREWYRPTRQSLIFQGV